MSVYKKKNTKKRNTKNQNKEIAKEHIKQLFAEAQKIFSVDKALANRYMYIAMKIKKKFTIPLTKEQKAHICKNCHAYLIPGRNCTIRIQKKFVIYHCHECNSFRRLTKVEKK